MYILFGINWSRKNGITSWTVTREEADWKERCQDLGRVCGGSADWVVWSPSSRLFPKTSPAIPALRWSLGILVPFLRQSFVGRGDFFSLVSALSILSTKDPSSPGAAEAFTSPPFRRGTHPKFPLASHARSRSFRFPFICRWVGPLQRRAAACVGRGRHGRPPASFAVPSRPCLSSWKPQRGWD